jgi:hypothetical protein
MISRLTRVIILNACVAGVLLLTWAHDGHFIVLMGAILFLGINAPTIMLIKLIPQRAEDEFPAKLRALVWPFLICGWLVAAAALLTDVIR